MTQPSRSGQFEALISYTLTVDGSQQDVFGQALGKPQVIEVGAEVGPSVNSHNSMHHGPVGRHPRAPGRAASAPISRPAAR